MDAGLPRPGGLDELAELLGISPRDPELIRQAFVHSSYFNENPTLVSGHNERLEFYGDAVIGLTVSRLIRVAYGPFQLGMLPEGEIDDVPAKVLREQAITVVSARVDGLTIARRGLAGKPTGDDPRTHGVAPNRTGR